MEEKGLIAIVGIVGLICMQMVGWYFGKDGIITGTVGTLLGLIVGYYFRKKDLTGASNG